MTNWSDTKPLQYRTHANSRIAEVRRQADRRFSASARPATRKSAVGEFSVNIATQAMARLIADLHAHPGCDGVGCGPWQDVPAPSDGVHDAHATSLDWIDEQVQRVDDLQLARNVEQLIEREFPRFVRTFSEALETATQELTTRLGATLDAVTCTTSAIRTIVKCSGEHGHVAMVVVRPQESMRNIDLDFRRREPGRHGYTQRRRIGFFTDETNAVRAWYDGQKVDGPEALASAVIRDAFPPHFLQKLAKRD